LTVPPRRRVDGDFGLGAERGIAGPRKRSQPCEPDTGGAVTPRHRVARGIEWLLAAVLYDQEAALILSGIKREKKREN
jgi:hypothetical protein